MILQGYSMLPTLTNGSLLWVQAQDNYQVGDIIVFHYLDKGFVVHRIINIRESIIVCKGDNSNRREVILLRQVLGKVVSYLLSDDSC